MGERKPLANDRRKRFRDDPVPAKATKKTAAKRTTKKTAAKKKS